MGKHQHSKDKLYVIASEYARDWGGYKKKKESLPFRCLPYYCCGLSMLPFGDMVVCTKEGIVFEAKNILEYIKKFGKNPVNGQKLSISDLIPLKFHKNLEGQFHCPVTYKIFNDHSHIVANSISGNVYSHEAIDTLNRKAKHWNDLLTGEPFKASDIITIQSPLTVEKRKIEEFDFIEKGVAFDPLSTAQTGELDSAPLSEYKATIQPTDMMNRIFEKIKNSAAATADASCKTVQTDASSNKAVQDSTSEASCKRPKHSLYTTHRQAAGFTSTIVGVHNPGVAETEYREMTEVEVREELYTQINKKGLKGYVRLQTTMGVLNIELHADKTPMAAHNFILHCESGYYNNTIFHRCLKNFMIQGGDPEGTGIGGKSAFPDGEPFKDEFHQKLTHSGIGILAMANSGPNSNKSQFYFTFKSCEHLNNKHTIFGRVVGGLDVLRMMEKLETNTKNDRPKHPPRLLNAVVFKNPFAEIRKKLDEEARSENEAEKKAESFSSRGQALDPMRDHPHRDSDSVGKYIPMISTTTRKRKREA